MAYTMPARDRRLRYGRCWDAMPDEDEGFRVELSVTEFTATHCRFHPRGSSNRDGPRALRL